MQPHGPRLSQRGTWARGGSLYARASGVIVAALAMIALILTGASSMNLPSAAHIFAPGAKSPRPVSGDERSANGLEPVSAGFHPGALPLQPGTWTAEGPAPLQGAQVSGNPNDQTHDRAAGAIKGVAAHPSDPNTVYVSTVNGGIWKTVDGGATWTPQTDAANSLSGGPIKFDPTDGTHNALIAGSGNFSALAALGGPKDGVLMTTDGATWNPPPGNATLTGANINGVAARGQVLIVASDSAMYRSFDGGTTFNQISGNGMSGLPLGRYLDLAEEPPSARIPDGVVMVSDGAGCVQEWSNNGTFIKTICGGAEDAGSTFDTAGNFYLTLFGDQKVAAFDPTGMFTGFGPTATYNFPESIEQDNAGNLYVGNAGLKINYCDPTTGTCYSQCFQPQDDKTPPPTPCPLLQFDPTFTTLLNTWYPNTEVAPAGKERLLGRGIDWGALVPVSSTNPLTPQCTMRYTSDGVTIKQFDVCAGTQILPDFATALPGDNAFALAVTGIPPNDRTFVADTESVLELDNTGTVIKTYAFGAANVHNPIFALSLDPDGMSFWTSLLNSGDVFKIDIQTGKTLVHFTTMGGSLASGITVKRGPLYTAVTSAGKANGIYKSLDWGKSWTLMDPTATTDMNALIQNGVTTNVKIAVGAQNNVFVGIINNNVAENQGDLAGLFRSGDGGQTWATAIATLPTTTEACPATFGINPGHQGALHFSLVADPVNPKVVYVGGDRQPAANEMAPPATPCPGPQFPNSLGASNFTGRLFRVSDTGFSSLTDQPGIGSANGTAPHAGSRAMVFDASGNLLEGDDGGIFKRTSP
ncbi:MAG TPA: hypothetical protein VNU00_06250, partial [Candidatus Binataceae bacterium]|nr:hypothetical protein [Candidatus Binataceae bacterium]